MTLPMLQGWGDALKGLPGIVQGGLEIANPNLQLQENLKQAISQHPELAQQLANLESNNPGVLAKTFGDSNIVRNLTSIKPDAATQEDQATRPAILAAAADPANSQYIVRNALGVPTAADIQGQTLRNQAAAGDVAAQGQESTLRGQNIQLNNLNLQQAQIKAANNTRAQQIIAGNPNLSPQHFFDGTLSLNDQEALFNSDLAPVLEQRLNEYNKQQDRVFNIVMRQQDRADNHQQAVDQFVRDKTFTTGIQMSAAIGYAASPAAMVQLTDPTVNAKIGQIAASGVDPSTLDPATAELVRGYNGLQNLQNYNATKRSNVITANQIKFQQPLFNSIKAANSLAKDPKADPNAINATLTPVNQALSALGNKYHVGYVNVSTGFLGMGSGKNQIKVLDSQGKVVDGMQPADLIQGIFKSSTPVSSNPTPSTNVGITTNAVAAPNNQTNSNPAITGLVNKYNTLNPAGKAQAKIFAKQTYSPADYQAFLAGIGSSQ